MRNGELTLDDIRRYSRQMILPDMSARAQKRLLGSSVTVIGAGGIGSPALLYLAAAGIGRLHVIDDDRVDPTNLNRQVIYTPDDVGRSKAEVACERITAFNPGVDAVPVRRRLTYENAVDLIPEGTEAVLDGTDNIPTRYAANDAAVVRGIPLFHSAFLQYEGRVTTIIPHESACLRCIFPEPPPPGSVPTCREAGILGATIGVLASIQVLEAVRYLAGLSVSLTDRLLIFDARRCSFRTMETQRDPECTACGLNGFTPSPVDGTCPVGAGGHGGGGPHR